MRKDNDDAGQDRGPKLLSRPPATSGLATSQ
jgi:hypothetical protein